MIQYNKVNSRIWSMLGSRRVLGVAINELANTDENFTFVTADVGRYYAIGDFLKNHPDKYVNVGIAEQNMIGVAAGMAKEGFNVYAATYSTFATARILDQIRVNLGLMRLGVKIIGVSAGLAEGDMSATHMGLEDVANIRSIPGITIFSPADCTETMKVFEASLNISTPVYIRLTGAAGCPIVYKDDYDFQVGKAIKLEEGEDIAIIASGTMVHYALKTAKALRDESISCTVMDMHTIEPLDKNAIDQLLDSHKYLVTVEEHTVKGGLGSAVAEYIAPKRNTPPLLMIGTDGYYPRADRYENLLVSCGLGSEQIKDKIKKFINM